MDLKLHDAMNPSREFTVCGTGPCSKEEEEAVVKKLKEMKRKLINEN